MAMTAAYLDALANAGAAAITHVGLVDGSGAEVATRQAVEWDVTSGEMRPSADVVFTVAAGDTVAGWRGYSGASAGTNFGGADLTPQPFATEGTYTLLAASTSVDHNAA